MHKNNDNFYSLQLGDDVFVHGFGTGRIIDIHKSEWPSGDRVSIKHKGKCRCTSCGNVHEHEVTLHVHPRNVSLTPTGKAMRAGYD